LINHTNEGIVREHWHGGGDIIQLTGSLARIAPLVLPKRVRRVLSSRIERAPEKQDAAEKVASMKFVEVPERDTSGGER